MEEDLDAAYEFFAGLFAEDEVDDGTGAGAETGTEAELEPNEEDV